MDRLDKVLLFGLLLSFADTVFSSAQQHRVHNLILYPDKHEWCNATEIEMVITHPGCTPRVFSNRVCAGQCFSYASPRTRPANQMEDQLRYCALCAPSNVTWQTIVLDCDTDRYSIFQQEVELIHECACSPCNPQQPQARQQHDSDLDNFVYEYDQNEVYGDYNADEANNHMQRIVQNNLNADDRTRDVDEDARTIDGLTYEVLAAIPPARDDASPQQPQQQQHRRQHPHRNEHAEEVHFNVHDPSSRQYRDDGR